MKKTITTRIAPRSTRGTWGWRGMGSPSRDQTPTGVKRPSFSCQGRRETCEIRRQEEPQTCSVKSHSCSTVFHLKVTENQYSGAARPFFIPLVNAENVSSRLHFIRFITGTWERTHGGILSLSFSLHTENAWGIDANQRFIGAGMQRLCGTHQTVRFYTEIVLRLITCGTKETNKAVNIKEPTVWRWNATSRRE